ncbi:MAG: hypothetical protein JJE19_08470, partial [Methanosarcinales archaeon]|nr:hypothetical protein [Methanosarcinales archaeon]
IDKEEVFSALNLGVVAAKTYTEERTTEDGSKRYHILIRTTKPILTKQLKFDEKEEISIRGENSLLVAGGTPYASGSAYEHFITSPKKIAAVDPGFFTAVEKLWNDYHGLGEKGGKSFSKLIKSVTLKTDILSVIRQCVESEGKKLEDYTDNGDYCQCRCPLPHHTDLQPSFTIYKKTNSYYCFGCSKGGNVITFLKEFYGFTIGEAVNRLKETGAIKEENEERFKRKAHFEKGGRLYLEILTRDEQYKYAHLNDSDDVELIDGVDDILPVELPVTKEGELALIVKMPDENVASSTLLSPVKLLEKIKAHISKYCDLPELGIQLGTYYVLFTWFYTKVNTVGYLRFLADTGKGKSRMLTVVSDICFYPTSAGGSSSFSGMMRTQEYWHGTLVMDEADWTGDKESSIVKYLNAGFERDKYFILSNKNDPSKQEVFDPFSTKIIAMREPFRDNATEGRLLSISPHETTKASIPILLGKEYYEEAAELRNEIARFVLVHWNDVDGEKMLDFRGLGIEPRLQQLAKPLSIIFQMWNDGEEIFKRYILKRQKELKKELKADCIG